MSSTQNRSFRMLSLLCLFQGQEFVAPVDCKRAPPYILHIFEFVSLHVGFDILTISDFSIFIDFTSI